MFESSIQAEFGATPNRGMRPPTGNLASPSQSAPALYAHCSALLPSSFDSPGKAGGERRFLANPSPESNQAANRLRGEARLARQRIVHLSPFTRQILGILARRRTAIQRARGAGDGIRTRDIQLGRLALYHLSYPRQQDRRHPAALQPAAHANLAALSLPNQSPGEFPPPTNAISANMLAARRVCAVKWSAKPLVPVGRPCLANFESRKRR